MLLQVLLCVLVAMAVVVLFARNREIFDPMLARLGQLAWAGIKLAFRLVILTVWIGVPIALSWTTADDHSLWVPLSVFAWLGTFAVLAAWRVPVSWIWLPAAASVGIDSKFPSDWLATGALVAALALWPFRRSVLRLIAKYPARSALGAIGMAAASMAWLRWHSPGLWLTMTALFFCGMIWVVWEELRRESGQG